METATDPKRFDLNQRFVVVAVVAVVLGLFFSPLRITVASVDNPPINKRND